MYNYYIKNFQVCLKITYQFDYNYTVRMLGMWLSTETFWYASNGLSALHPNDGLKQIVDSYFNFIQIR